MSNEKLYIGIVLGSVPSYSETFFRSKIAGLAEKGHKVFLFASNKNNEKVNGAKVINSPKVTTYNPITQLMRMALVFIKLGMTCPKRTVRFIRLEKKDRKSLRKALENLYLNSHILPYSLDWLHFGFATKALNMENAAQCIGSKMAVSIRGYDIGIYPLKYKGCYTKLWNSIDAMHYLSDDLLNKAIKDGFNHQTKAVKITPAIDSEKFYVERKFDNHHKFNMVTIGRLNWKKGYEYGIKAVAILKRFGYSVEYKIIGDGEDEERLKYAAFQQGVQEEILFLGKMPHDKIVEILRKSNIYIQPSVQEGFCNSVLEAQAAGMLCIVSDAEGLAENVLHQQTGWVVPRRNALLLARTLSYVLHLPVEKKEKISRTAQQRVTKEFSIHDQIQKFVEFYDC